LPLQALTYLDLSLNLFSGTVPDAVSLASNLTDIRVYGNQLSGTLPASLSQLTGLTVLTVAYNALSGTVPNLSASTRLRSLFLSSNQVWCWWWCYCCCCCCWWWWSIVIPRSVAVVSKEFASPRFMRYAV
jgi:hypothetical protein